MNSEPVLTNLQYKVSMGDLFFPPNGNVQENKHPAQGTDSLKKQFSWGSAIHRKKIPYK